MLNPAKQVEHLLAAQLGIHKIKRRPAAKIQARRLEPAQRALLAVQHLDGSGKQPRNARHPLRLIRRQATVLDFPDQGSLGHAGNTRQLLPADLQLPSKRVHNSGG